MYNLNDVQSVDLQWNSVKHVTLRFPSLEAFLSCSIPSSVWLSQFLVTLPLPPFCCPLTDRSCHVFRGLGVSSTLIRFIDSSLNFHVKFRAWLLRLSLLRCDMASNQPCRKAAASPCPIRCAMLRCTCTLSKRKYEYEAFKIWDYE